MLPVRNMVCLLVSQRPHGAIPTSEPITRSALKAALRSGEACGLLVIECRAPGKYTPLKITGYLRLKLRRLAYHFMIYPAGLWLSRLNFPWILIGGALKGLDFFLFSGTSHLY